MLDHMLDMTGQKLRVLFLEDEPNDFALVERELNLAQPGCEVVHVKSHEQFVNELNTQPNLILSDHHLPEFDGFAALALAKQRCPQVPFIFVTGSVGEEAASDAIRLGAANIVFKNRMSATLGPAIRSAMELAHDKKVEANREIAELREQLHQRTAERDNAIRELESFSYSISHDLRAPLRHIDGFAELLSHSAADRLDDASKEYLDVITKSAREMGKLIDALLSFSRITRINLTKTRLPLRSVVDNVLTDLAYEGETRSIQWQIGELPEVFGDPSLLRQAFANLLSNALKFTRSRDQTQIEIGAMETTTDHIVYVRDNGVGFDPQFADKLFHPFQRLHTSSDHSGVGMGLANVRRIIQRHGGRTWAEGTPDGGATFYFTLPKESA